VIEEFLIAVTDPTIIMGVLTLIALEIVLGIDNLVFISILAEKLPPHQRDKARIIGLGGALVMRLLLLTTISWIVTLNEPLFWVLGRAFSGRDLIMLSGGMFLLFKATMELHERLEGHLDRGTTTKAYAGFNLVVAQIVVLDAVFSIDSVITAVGMVNHLSMMVVAVVIAVGVMMVASKPLTKFVSGHPTVIVLCLGFLMMIGLSLMAEGLGFHIPKGYLYAAIGFSVLVEAFNQFARSKRRRDLVSKRPLRERTAEAVLHLLGGKTGQASADISDLVGSVSSGEAFNPSEHNMIRGVLSLADRPVKSIMTPRTEIIGVRKADSEEVIRAKLLESPYSRLVVTGKSKDEPLGFLQKKDLLNLMLTEAEFKPLSVMKQPLIIPSNKPVLSLLEDFKAGTGQIAFIVDEFGSFEGIVTLTDVLETIAGDMREEHEEKDAPFIQPVSEHAYLVDGRTDSDDLQVALNIQLPDGEFHTAAGLILHVLQRMPFVGDQLTIDGWQLEVVQMDGNRVHQIRFTRQDVETLSLF